MKAFAFSFTFTDTYAGNCLHKSMDNLDSAKEAITSKYGHLPDFNLISVEALPDISEEQLELELATEELDTEEMKDERVLN